MTDASLKEAPPAADHVTDYVLQHLMTYLRLLDAAGVHADWREVAEVVLGIDTAAEPERARTVHASHLERARWMTRIGYRDLAAESSTR